MQTAQQRILCVDNHASRNLAIYLLERAGFEVSTAGSIADGLRLARAEPFDLYLLNHEVWDGPEIDSCEELRESVPRAPILFYSTVLYPYQQIRPIHCRSHDHMMKPVNACDVVRFVCRLIEEKKKRTFDATQLRLMDVNPMRWRRVAAHLDE